MQFKKNLTNTVVIFAILFLTFTCVFAADADFKQYYLISSKNLLEQEKIISSVMNIVNLYFNKQAAKDEADREIENLVLKFNNAQDKLSEIVITQDFKKIQNVNLRVTDNNQKAIQALGDMIKENYNFEYAEDYIKVLDKLQQITKMLYYNKEALISARIDFLENNKNIGAADTQKDFFKYNYEILKLQKEFMKTDFEINFYVLKYLAGKIEKYELRIIVQENLDKTKQYLSKCEDIKPEGKLTDIHKILLNGILENYTALQEFSNYLAGAKDININDVQKHLGLAEEIFNDYENKKINYLEEI